MVENQRLNIQSSLDEKKDQLDKNERNRLGQFATPTVLAGEIIDYGLELLKGKQIKFLDPAFGTGSFYSALTRNCDSKQIESASGVEIDEHYGKPASELWGNHSLNLEITDFTKKEILDEKSKSNLLICNPPYVRHHHLSKEDKIRLCEASEEVFKTKVSGLSGLYCHFIAQAHKWMEVGGIAGWLIPSEFMDVNYGKSLKNYLCTEVTLLGVHRYSPDDAQFDDALVSSAVVWVKNETPSAEHKVKFTYGGTLANPSTTKDVELSVLKKEQKWTRFPLKEAREESEEPKISNFFKIRRGLATGNNDFFIVTLEDAKKNNIPLEFLKPILPSPRHLSVKEVESEEDGTPKIDNKLFLVNCLLEPEQVEKDHPELWTYLNKGIELGVSKTYLCKNRPFWYKQEKREPSPYYCTYIGRKTKASNKPFSFILNHSEAVVTNSYLALEPLPQVRDKLANNHDLRREVWVALNAICGEQMKEEGRVYGGGMHKMEPKELANVPATEVAELLKQY